MATSSRQLSSFKVIGFDTMGTLLDERAGITVASKDILGRLPSDVSPEKLNEEFDKALRKQMKETPPPTTYAANMSKAFMTAMGVVSGGKYAPSVEESAAFAQALADWPAFHDTVSAMQTLAARAKLILLSNMDTSTLREITTEGALKDVPVAKLLGGDTSGAFKPDHRVNQNLLDVAQTEFGVERAEVLLVAQGLGSDHVPARDMGISSAWIDRYAAGKDAIPEGASPMWVFASLADLVAELQSESS